MSNYPMGAEADPRAPYNQKETKDLEIEENVKITVSFDSGELHYFFGDTDITSDFKNQIERARIKEIEGELWATLEKDNNFHGVAP